MRQAMSVEARVTVTVCKLVTNISEMLGLGIESTVGKIVIETCKSIAAQLPNMSKYQEIEGDSGRV